MSGGHFNYKDSTLKYEIFGYDEYSNVFEDREISELVWDIFELIHDFDWYRSGDTSEDDYLKAKDKFKKKWFSNRGIRIRQIVDAAIDETKQELYKTFRLEDKGN